MSMGSMSKKQGYERKEDEGECHPAKGQRVKKVRLLIYTGQT